MSNPDKKVDRDLLNEATHRELLHWTMILNLDFNLLKDDDEFETWAQRCKVDLRKMDEGGAVIRRDEKSAFFFIPPSQYELAEQQLKGYKKVNKAHPLFIRFFKFGAVGVSGVVVNLGIYALLLEYFHIADFISRSIAIEISILNNFLWNFIWTWADRDKSLKYLPGRLLRYHGSTFIASFAITLGIGWAVLKLVPDIFMVEYVSHTVGIVAGMVANFLMSDRWVFMQPKNEKNGNESDEN